MLVDAYPAGPLAANCYVVAPAAGAECVVIDPGQDASRGLAELLTRHDLTPAAVLLTHGHFDHVMSAAHTCAAYSVPVCVHPEDRELLTDPAKGLDPALAGQLSALLGDVDMREPADVTEIADGDALPYAGLEITVAHAPGHTPGSVAYAVSAETERTPALFTGDLLFAGGIGRTDFPGGDHAAILRSLRDTCLSRPDDTVVHPGHGPQSTVGRERATNPFLQEIAAS
ncbi:glyoxylase-like metal-dependent hydrolase (beta-lactamase superfamily II) [Haloactinospora alba]|uniref:Glyoxylase-like metal-dependent hydrolase (Beta-lactamase superfamily II) n=1 Tax=Haloactinospora alba TaxID=405555 RepID=A0A543NHF3_9ACTN|nr:MBL fold metallo-hydrolase [Haloactinospora alba]TQN31253.1 glyoxylase-like metal-dependent hydrolase (beta-lactamase superfamily II) [Haloactinospora alba]